MDGPISGEITLRNRCAGLGANSQLDIIILCIADRILNIWNSQPERCQV